MGTLWGGNGDEQPPGGGGPSDGMSGLPPEWGPIVIPDDASALQTEAAAVRRELRRGVRRDRWRRRLRLSAPGDREAPSLGAPLAIMAIAVVATLISLFAVAWPGAYNRVPNPDRVTTRARPLPLPDLTLSDYDGMPVRIRDVSPAVVVLVDRCACEQVVNQLAATVDPRIGVLVVVTPDPFAAPSASASGAPAPWPGVPSARPSTSSPMLPGTPIGPTLPATANPAPTATPDPFDATDDPTTSGAPPGAPSRNDPSTRSGPPGVRVRMLVDPAGALRASVPGLPAPGASGVLLLVSFDWAVMRVVVPAATPVSDLKNDLDRLVG
jgi:hypothetical protein